MINSNGDMCIEEQKLSDLESIVLANANHVETVFSSLDDNFKEHFNLLDIEMLAIYIHDDIDFVNYETVLFNIKKCNTLREIVDFLEDKKVSHE